MRTLVIDIETTGLPQKGHTYEANFMDFPYIVGIAWKLDNQESVDFIINQEGREIPKEASDINGITTEIANKSEHMLQDVILKLLAVSPVDCVIGHNIYFDTSIIKANILRLIAQEKLPKETSIHFEELVHKDKRIDTMRKSIKFCGVGTYPKLSVLYSKLFNENFEAHNSKNDVEATYKCYLKLKELGHILEEVKV